MSLNLSEGAWIEYTDKNASRLRVGCIIDCLMMDNKGEVKVVMVQNRDSRSTTQVPVRYVVKNTLAPTAPASAPASPASAPASPASAPASPESPSMRDVKLLPSDSSEDEDESPNLVESDDKPIPEAVREATSDDEQENDAEGEEKVTRGEVNASSASCSGQPQVAPGSPHPSLPSGDDGSDDEQVDADTNEDVSEQNKRAHDAPESEKGPKKAKTKQVQKAQQEEEAAQADVLDEKDSVQGMVEQILAKSHLNKHANWLEQPPERVEVRTTDPLYAKLDGNTPLQKLRSFVWVLMGKDASKRARMDKLVGVLFLVMATKTNNYSDLKSALAYFRKADPKEANAFLRIRVLNKRGRQEELKPFVRQVYKALVVLGDSVHLP